MPLVIEKTVSPQVNFQEECLKKNRKSQKLFKAPNPALVKFSYFINNFTEQNHFEPQSVLSRGLSGFIFDSFFSKIDFRLFVIKIDFLLIARKMLTIFHQN